MSVKLERKAYKLLKYLYRNKVSTPYPEKVIKMCKDIYGLAERIDILKSEKFIVYIKGYHIDGGDYDEYYQVSPKGKAYLEERFKNNIIEKIKLIILIISFIASIVSLSWQYADYKNNKKTNNTNSPSQQHSVQN